MHGRLVARRADARAMMLAGLTPEVIVDIVARGMAFYDAQLHLELVGRLVRVVLWQTSADTAAATDCRKDTAAGAARTGDAGEG